MHISRAHLQTVLTKVADEQAPPNLNITKYGWKIKDGLQVSRIADQSPGPLPPRAPSPLPRKERHAVL